MNVIDKELIVKIDTLKAKIDEHRPLPNHTIESLKAYFRVGLTYSSNALEGNSLTETETKVIIEDGLTAGGKPLKDHLEVIGHVNAYEFMYECSKKTNLSLLDILEIHRLFYGPVDLKHAGVFRKTGIAVTGTNFAFPKPANLEKLMEKFVKNISAWKKELHPVESAGRAHLELVTIHPFVDGNGRTARLLMNVMLLRNGYPITIIPPILRMEYINALRMGNFGKYENFLNLIANTVHESCKEYLRLIQNIN